MGDNTEFDFKFKKIIVIVTIIVTITTNMSQHVEFFHSLIFFNRAIPAAVALGVNGPLSLVFSGLADVLWPLPRLSEK